MILGVYEESKSDLSLLSHYCVGKLHLLIAYRSKIYNNTYYVYVVGVGTIVDTLSINRPTYRLEKKVP